MNYELPFGIIYYLCSKFYKKKHFENNSSPLHAISAIAECFCPDAQTRDTSRLDNHHQWS
jgi:hypothetical protein